ncbi:GntR family transcriptional regulator [Frankia sp. R43]|uniref:GntR family transcriptional regulator n=1 Tax=Frankia sp. R43 TaxID=269536 RepID=UPI0006CA31FA|nr:GntR family transcriptional regulator [Frankia sp. R43]KPM50711.1 GntR family transcriptional regulator [Frankia sp. R43]
MTRPAGTRRARGTPLTRAPQLADEVAAHLRDLIMSGEIWPGQYIRLDDVARELGVSVTPVREALVRLRSEDMVELEPRRGYVVTPLSQQDVRDLFNLQGHIAGELAARAATTIDPPHLTQLHDIQQALRNAVETENVDQIEQLEFEFHRVINRLAHARKLSWFLHTANRYTPARFYSTDQAWRADMLQRHDALLTALENKNTEEARAITVRHFTDGADRLINHLAKLGMWRPHPVTPPHPRPPV